MSYGKNSFARNAQGESLMRKAATSGMTTVAPFVIGLGVSWMLYYFFNVTSSTGNVMVGVLHIPAEGGQVTKKEGGIWAEGY